MTTKLSPHQVVQNIYDEPSNTVRISIQNMELAMELSADDGDSVTAVPKAINSYATFSTAQTTGAVAIAPIDVSFCTSLNLTVKNQGTAVSVAIEVSPSDTAGVWIQLSTLNATNGITNTTPSLFPCRRARVVFNGNFLGDGQIELWLNGRG